MRKAGLKSVRRSMGAGRRLADAVAPVLFEQLEERQLLTAAGELDPSFGTGGKLLTDFSGSALEQINDVVIQSDNKILAVGSASGQLALARYFPDGLPDNTFGTNGQVTTSLESIAPGATGEIRAVAVQSDGKIVVAGSINDGGATDFLVARYNADGTLDTSFDGDGIARTDFGDNEQAYDVAVTNDRIVAVGGHDGAFDIACYQSSNGLLDPGFGNIGKLSPTIMGTTASTLYAVAFENDGKIVVAGNAIVPGNDSDFAVMRLNEDGTPDNNFGDFGSRTTDFAAGSTDIARALLIDGNNNVFVVGQSQNGFAMAKYTSAGALDTSFGTNGTRVSPFVGTAIAYDVSLDTSGKLVLGGDNDGLMAMARYLPDGTPDDAFGTNGIATLDFGGAGNATYAMAYQRYNDRTVLAGTSDSQFSLARVMMFPTTVDTIRPTATASPSAVNNGGGTAYTFSVTYTDAGGMDENSITSDDVFVSGPLAPRINVTMMGKSKSGNSITATYQMTPPGGSWDSLDNGRYYISIVRGAVWDSNYNSVTEGQIPNAYFDVNIPADTTPPTATLSQANPVRTGGTFEYTFTVRYADDFAIYNEFHHTDILVKNAATGFSSAAQFVSATQEISGDPRFYIATYKLLSRTWTAADNGTYTIELQPDHVRDRGGNAVPAGTLGTFQVDIPPGDGTRPTASLVNYTFQPGGSTITVQVRYADSTAIKASTLTATQVHITGPNGYDQTATYTSVDSDTDGSPRIVTYTATAPGGVWDAGDNGTYQVSLAPDDVTDTSGNKVEGTLSGSFFVNIAFAKLQAGVLTVTGTDGDDMISLTSSAGNITATVNGTSQNFLASSVISILVNAMGGNDIVAVWPGVGGVVIDGGDGNDSLIGGNGNDTLLGGAGNDTLHGGAGNDLLDGGTGADDLWGDAGTDTADYSNRTAAVRLSIDNRANDGERWEGDNIHADIESLVGGSGNDILVGSAGNNRLMGGAGNDTLNGGAGNDLLDGGTGADLIIGGKGIDTVTYASRTKRVYVSLDNKANDGQGKEKDNVRIDVENVIGGKGDDILTGSLYANSLSGGAGVDLIRGGGGNDTIDGGIGHDRLYGDSGNDLFITDDRQQDQIDGGNGDDVVRGEKYDIRTNIESLVVKKIRRQVRHRR